MIDQNLDNKYQVLLSHLRQAELIPRFSCMLPRKRLATMFSP